MEGTRPSRTLSVSIARPPEDVYAFVANPENLPRWSFFTSVARQGDRWIATSAAGSTPLRFVDPNALGVLDHFVTTGPSTEIYVPMRVVPNGTGSEVLFTLFRLETMTEHAFERDAETVGRDLIRLKRVLESRHDSPALTVREEQPGDVEAIHRINEAAFGQALEARLVDALRRAGAVTLSLVAVADGEVVGHVLFSPVTIGGHPGVEAVGLGPMAVLPHSQRRGVGSELVRSGLERLREAGYAAVVVLGHPDYYPRFGFRRASEHGLRWERDAPDAAFMALELRAGALSSCRGVVSYRPEFDEV
jgi:putative acetyltransferase